MLDVRRRWLMVIACTGLLCGATPGLADDEDEGEVIVRGAISALADDGVTIADVLYRVTEATEFEGLNDQPILFAEFKVGDYVKAKAVPEGEQGFILRELELEEDERHSDDDDDGDEDDDDNDGDDNSEDAEDDDGRDRSSRQPSGVTTRCNFPNQQMLERGIGASIAENLRALGATRVRVNVRSKIVARDAAQSLSPIAATAGLAVTTARDGSVSIGGSAAPISCDGVLRVIATVKGRSATGERLRARSSHDVAVVGVAALRGKR